MLIQHFLNQRRRPGPEPAIDEAALRILTDYDYPGNVRELQTLLQSAVNLAQGGPLTTACLPQAVIARAESVRKAACPEPEPASDGPVAPLSEVEKNHILDVYRHTGQNKSQAARLLGIGLNTLRRKLRAYGMTD